MANMTFGVNLIPNNSGNTVYKLGNSDKKWDIYSNILNSLLIGTGTTGQDKGSGVSPRYIPAKWDYDYNIATPQDGDIITVKIPVAGHSYGDWISLDNGTTYYPIVTNGLTKLTTHYPVNSYITLIFEENGSASTISVNGADSTSNITVDGGVWRVINFYDSNTTNIVNLYTGSGNYLADSVIYRYQLLFQTNENTLTPLNNVSNSTATNKTMLTNVEFNPFGKIFYYNSTTTVNAGAEILASTQYYAISGLDIRYTLNCGTTLTAHKPLYLVVTPQNNGKVKLASSSPWTQTLPTSNDGKWYILLGRAYSKYQIALYSHHPVYTHDGIKIRNVLPDGYIIPTKVSELNNDSGFTTNVGTITGITMNGASKGTSGVVDLGTVITSHQSLANYAPKASPTLTGTPTAPTASAGTNTTQIATTAFVMNAFQANDAMVFKGTIGSSGATVTSLPATHYQGWTYKVITAGTYAGQACEIGDMIICVTDGTSATNSHWTVVQSNVDGAVTGPTSSTDAHVATFNGTTGKVIKDSGFTIAKSVPSDAKFTDTTYSSKTAASGGTDVSLVTTGEKYIWNNKSDLIIGTTASTAAAGNHTHGLSIATNSGTSVITLAASTKYKLTAGGSTYIFTTPPNTTYDNATTSTAGLMSASDKTKLDGIASGAQVNSITGIKGNAESTYRTGNVNLTSANIGAVAKSGDTMTGSLAVKDALNVYSDANPNIGFMNADRTVTIGRIYNIDSSRRFYFRIYHPDNNSNYDDFMLPSANGSGENAFYDILTTKSAITVTQGGTGAIDAPGARENLGITPANIGAAADSAAMQYRGWCPNGQSMLGLTPGYYRTSPDHLPSETFPSDINAYGTLCVDNTGYTHITYIGVLGDFMIWKSNATAGWYVVQHEGKVLVTSGGTGATTAAGARTNLGITPANIGAMPINPASIELIPSSGTGHGGFIDFHYNGSTSDNTVRLMESAEGVLSIKATSDTAYYPILTTKTGVAKSGDTMTGDLTVQNPTSGTNSNIYVKTTRSSGSVQIYADNEGGNIKITSPNSKYFEMDMYDDSSLRFYTYNDNDQLKVFYFWRTGAFSIPGALYVGNAPVSRANLKNYIILDTATLADTWSKLSDINSHETIPVYMTDTVAKFLTGNGGTTGKVSLYCFGTVLRADIGDFRFNVDSSNGDYHYGWKITYTRDSNGTPTALTTGTVYRIAATSI